MERVIAILNSIAMMSDDLINHLKSILSRKEYENETTILKAGQVCRYIYFIESGAVRIHFQQGNKDVTTWFLFGDDICISVNSFHRQTPSREDITTMGPVIIWGVTWAQLRKTCELYPEFRVHEAFLLWEYYSFSEDRRQDIERLSATERYTRLLDKTPDILDRVKLKYIASYLKISKASLDRTRSEMRKRKI